VKWELYDLASDPKEAHDVLATEPVRVAALRKGLNGWLESVVRSLNGEDYSQK
jgi:hypothetical protein